MTRPILLALAALCVAARCAHAQQADPVTNAPASPAQGQGTPTTPVIAATETPPLFSPDRAALFGTFFGLRPWLNHQGITLGISDINEVIGNPTGGTAQSAAYEALTTLGLAIDGKQAFGWAGLTLNISALQIRGRNLSQDELLTLQNVSNLEADRSTRLWELWADQSFADGRIDIRLGQQSWDQEFIASTNGMLFVAPPMGWPAVPSIDLYAGSAVYPLASLGARLRAAPTERLTLLAGVFDDNPAGGPFANDGQVRAAAQSGTAFSLGTGAIVLAEMQYALNQPVAGQKAAPGEHLGLPGAYKLGFWIDSGAFPDQQTDTAGRPLADPSSAGVPRQHHGNAGLYALADQMIWRPDPTSLRAVSLFARVTGAPGDRNLVDFSANGGITLKAPFADRDNDAAGFGGGVVHISGTAAATAAALAAATGTYAPLRTEESFVELTYQAQIAGWLVLQPDLQYIFMPNGGVVDPNRPGARVGNAWVLGVRSAVTF